MLKQTCLFKTCFNTICNVCGFTPTAIYIYIYICVLFKKKKLHKIKGYHNAGKMALHHMTLHHYNITLRKRGGEIKIYTNTNTYTHTDTHVCVDTDMQAENESAVTTCSNRNGKHNTQQTYEQQQQA